MPTKNFFDKYEVSIYGGAKDRVALLMCYLGTSFMGRIDFYPDNVELPEDYLWHPNISDYLIVLHMPMSRFEPVMSMVRQEKPLNLYIDANRGREIATHGSGCITTSEKESVGEQEGV